jgi:hypothetical protein
MLNIPAKMPRWLEKANKYLRDYYDLQAFTDKISSVKIKEILEDSCYYLSAGADITPIIAFKDTIFSYILSDKNPNSINGIDNNFNGALVKLKDRLIKQGFTEIQKFNLDKRFLDFRDIHYEIGDTYKLENCEISFWRYGESVYSILYINFDNTLTYQNLYIKNGVVPKAICEILPDGGSITSWKENGGQSNLSPMEKKLILPEFALGHLDTIGDREQYEKIKDNVEYFGDYDWERNGLKMFKRKL